MATVDHNILRATINNLPLVDAQVMEILTLLDAPDTNFNDIAGKLSPEVTTSFLKIANSSFYGQHVQDINHALRVLGFNAMKQSLTTSLMMAHFEKSIDPQAFNIDKFHNQAQLCAGISTVITRILAYEKAPEVFTVAITHNIGKLIIAAYFPTEHRQINLLKKQKYISASEAEKIVLGHTHAEIGAVVLEKFKIPADLCQAVRRHEDYGYISSMEDAEDFEITLILQESVRIVDKTHLPGKIESGEIVDWFEALINEERTLIQEIKVAGIKERAYRQVFSEILERTGKFVENRLTDILRERGATGQ